MRLNWTELARIITGMGKATKTTAKPNESITPRIRRRRRGKEDIRGAGGRLLCSEIFLATT